MGGQWHDFAAGEKADSRVLILKSLGMSLG